MYNILCIMYNAYFKLHTMKNVHIVHWPDKGKIWGAPHPLGTPATHAPLTKTGECLGCS